MSSIIAVTGAITAATRLSKKLEKLGYINSQVIHTPLSISVEGCSYSVRTDENALESIRNLNKKPAIRIKKLYKEVISSEGREYYDIS